MKIWISSFLLLVVCLDPIVKLFEDDSIYLDDIRSEEIDLSTLRSYRYSFGMLYHHLNAALRKLVYPDDSLVREFKYREAKILYKLSDDSNLPHLKRSEVERSIGALYKYYVRHEKKKDKIKCLCLSRGLPSGRVSGIALVGPNVEWPENVHCTLEMAQKEVYWVMEAKNLMESKH